MLPAGFEEVPLSPLVPIGTHGIGGVAQSRLLATERGTEVAADPTNGLALEAAVRRRALLTASPRSPEVVRLAASQRVVRAQRFVEAAAFSHFQLFGLVSAGRDTGAFGFESEAIVEHLRFHVEATERVTGGGARVSLTDLSEGQMGPLFDAISATFGADRVRLDPDRPGGRDYYTGLRFKVHVLGRSDGEPFEVSDGGFVDWTQRLLADRKERLLISGIGVERLALA